MTKISQTKKNRAFYHIWVLRYLAAKLHTFENKRIYFGRPLYSGQSNFEFEYLVKFETEFENILGCESVFQVGSFDEKNQSPKISCYCPFNIIYKI
jgi:hypothetical protein